MSRLVSILASLVLLAPAGALAGPPNVLVVLSDDHSAAHVGCYGNKDVRTPNLDKFAAAGMRFDRAYVACPQCVPSRATLMTGRSPVAIDMTRFSAALPADVVTYPEILKQGGYFTGVAGRTYHLDGPGANVAEAAEVLNKHGLRTFPKRLDFVKTAAGGDRCVAQFREFLDAVPAGKPFFLQLCFNDPHRPLDANAIPTPHDPDKLTLPRHFPDTKLVREDFARYYDEIARLDGHFGEVLAELDKRKLAGDTVVVFSGDNGAAQWRGKGTLYEFGIRVPLLVRWPGQVKAGTSTAEIVSGEDLAPTLLEAAGATPPKEMTGKSYLPLLRGREFAGRKFAFAERGAHGSGLPTGSAAFDLGRCVVGKTHKFIYNATWQLPYQPVDFGNSEMWKEVRQLADAGKLPAEVAKCYDGKPRAMFELYDLEKDPAELTNLAGKAEAAAVEKEVRAALVEWMTLQRDFLPLPVAPARP